ncbi:hypothetical protein [Sphingobium xenophagum]|uniref:hypothetical protein n=1 Tax=Sphingobium xenophagum TaxID=121428 RepID=UPI001C0B3F6A|nr:hypothetical protein [Sphingobium xenophagum]QWT16627.1 hypothetical protein GTV57_19655 [Sphingobium xenophagum]
MALIFAQMPALLFAGSDFSFLPLGLVMLGFVAGPACLIRGGRDGARRRASR